MLAPGSAEPSVLACTASRNAASSRSASIPLASSSNTTRPAESTTTRVEIATASCRSCVARRIPAPRSRARRTAISRKPDAASGSRFWVGSSSRSSGGSAKQRAGKRKAGAHPGRIAANRAIGGFGESYQVQKLVCARRRSLCGASRAGRRRTRGYDVRSFASRRTARRRSSGRSAAGPRPDRRRRPRRRRLRFPHRGARSFPRCEAGCFSRRRLVPARRRSHRARRRGRAGRGRPPARSALRGFGP